MQQGAGLSIECGRYQSQLLVTLNVARVVEDVHHPPPPGIESQQEGGGSAAEGNESLCIGALGRQ